MAVRESVTRKVERELPDEIAAVIIAQKGNPAEVFG
jgi:hypothetical protein